MHARQLHLVTPGSPVKLSAIDPSGSPGLAGPKDQERAAAESLHAQNVLALQDLQYRLYAERSRALLVVLQGLDTAGKDGVIRHVFGPLNPLGVRVAAFKQPNAEELAHDYLWRVHREAPARGEVVVFNRSHYEDVLVVRVHELVPEETWRRRFEEINAFERLLTSAGTTVLKFYLHISRDEQRERLRARLDDPAKRWKFAIGDLDERKRWDEYIEAYEEAISLCSTACAPWFVIPANRKWYRDWAISSILRAELERMNPTLPSPDFDPSSIKID